MSILSRAYVQSTTTNLSHMLKRLVMINRNFGQLNLITMTLASSVSPWTTIIVLLFTFTFKQDFMNVIENKLVIHLYNILQRKQIL